MQIYPAIDIKDGRAVRLRQGLAADVTDYGTPAEAAMDWKTQGATYLHVVDLDGAFEGKGRNLPLVAEIVRETGLPVELGGGIRTMEDIEARLSLGVARVILGTVALTDPDLVRRTCARYPGASPAASTPRTAAWPCAAGWRLRTWTPWTWRCA